MSGGPQAARQPQAEPAQSAFDRFMATSTEVGRKTGTLMTPEEVAEALGKRCEKRLKVTYSFLPGGRCEPPDQLTFTAAPEVYAGVSRALAKMFEHFGWHGPVSVEQSAVFTEGVAHGGREGA